MDTRTQRNMSKLNSELNEVQSIMTKNIQEVLGQGEKLESEWGREMPGAGGRGGRPRPQETDKVNLKSLTHASLSLFFPFQM